MSLPDLLVFFIITISQVLFGISFYFKNKNQDQFTRAGGKIPTWVAGLSIFATYVSSISFLAIPGKAYSSNWNALVFSFSIPLAAWLAVKFFVPLYRQQKSISAYAFLEQRFGPWARKYAAGCYLLTQLMRTGAILMLLALPMQNLFGWPIQIVILFSGIIITIYTVTGGIKAVLWTDAIQGIVLIIGAVVCAVLITYSIPSGIKQIWSIGQSYGKFSLGSFTTDLTSSTFWVVLIYGLFINLQNYGIDQNYIQRYQTTESTRAAQLSTWWGALLYLPVSWLFCFIGSALFVYYQLNPNRLPESMLQSGLGDQIFPYFIAHELPTGLTGLLIAAIFAAGMSTISTSVNSAATIIFTDFMPRFADQLADKAALKSLRWLSLLFGLGGTLIALSLVGVQNVLDTWWALASIFSGGMLGLFLLGFLSSRVQNIHAAIGVLVGGLVIMWMSLSPLFFTTPGLLDWKSPLHINLTIVFGTIAILLTGFLSVRWFNLRNVLK